LGIIAKIQLSGEYINIIIDDKADYLADQAERQELYREERQFCSSVASL